MTESSPSARKSSDLKIACDHMWKSPAPGPAAAGALASADSMIATWLTVDQASSRLRSLWPSERTAARTMVIAVAIPNSHRATSAWASTGKIDPRTTVPAATIVAAWMSAEAGVGPSIASASQSWKGTEADFPNTPMTSRHINTLRSTASGPVHAPRVSQVLDCAHVETTSSSRVVRAPMARPTTPSTNPMSARRVTRKALRAARRALALRDQCPINR